MTETEILYETEWVLKSKIIIEIEIGMLSDIYGHIVWSRFLLSTVKTKPIVYTGMEKNNILSVLS